MKNSNKSFSFAITTLSGARFWVFLKVSARYGVEWKFLGKWLLSGLVSLISTLLGFFDFLVFLFIKKPKVKEPVFVIGHWRSGTTLLHNLLALDDKSGYTTTYHSVFPNNLVAFQWLFKSFMKWMMPSNRPVDNVKLDVEFPQEEEFAINNEIPFSFYNWWYFPKRTREIAKRYLVNKDASEMEKKRWRRNYKRFAQRALINTKGTRFISKNPPHTARMEEILKIFPDAKFIFIHRNPYEVVRSTLNFYKSILPGTQFQEIDETQLFQDILWVYAQLMDSYESQKKGVDPKKIMEIRYSNLVQNPEKCISNVYRQLLGEDDQEMLKRVRDYTKGSSHVLKSYSFEKEYVQKVSEKLEKVIVQQGYELLD